MDSGRTAGSQKAAQNEKRSDQKEEGSTGRGDQPRAKQKAGQSEQRPLTVLYTNARSIASKLSELEAVISEHEPDIFLVTESWCNSEISNSLLNIKGYYIDPDLRADRKDTANGIGGGLLVYCKEGLDILPLDNNNDFNQYRQFLVKSNNQNVKDFHVTLVYRSPNSSVDNTDLLCDLISKCPENNLIIGDFNLPNIDWNNYTCDKKSQKFVDTIENKFFSQLIDFPTHVKGNILDLAITDIPDKVVNIESVGNLGSSDHSILRFDFMLSIQINETIEKIDDWNKADIDGFNDFLCNIDWNCDMNDMTADEAWLFFRKKVDEGKNLFVPTIERRKKHRPRWIKRKITKLSRKKQSLWKVYLNDKSTVNFSNYKLAEKDFKRAVRNCKRQYEKNLSKSDDCKKFYGYIKSKIKNVTKIGPLKANDTIVSDNTDVCNLLNRYFCSVFTVDNETNVPVLEPCNASVRLCDIIYDTETIEKKIDKLKKCSAPGPDGISVMFLQTFKYVISLPLCIIYKKSFNSGCVPEEWKCANITPIFKKGSKSDPSNYRPVSLTSIPCKIDESIIKDALVDHLLCNSLLNLSQHGFLPNRSCLTNLLEFFEFVTKSVDEGLPVDVIYLDFSKAFDKVLHKRLISKLKAHNVDGKLLNWIQNWLSNRKQRVVINGHHSDWGLVKSGVPQGSVLGPILFVIFIDDLDLSTSVIDIVNKFADDTKIGKTVNCVSDQSALQQCLNSLCDWALKWGMNFNEKKCNVLHFGRKNKLFDYHMNGTVLSKVTEERDVGVKIDHSLKPSKHCASIASKANSILGQMTRSFHYRDRHVFLKLYKTYIRCHLEYCTPVWSPWSKADIDALEKVQERAVNMISGLSSHSYEDKLKELNLQSLAARRERFDMIQTFKIIHKKDNVNSEIFFKLANPSAYVTRLTSCPYNITPQISRLDIRKNFYSNRVINTWNSLPSDLKEAPSVASFKNRYDKLIVSK